MRSRAYLERLIAEVARIEFSYPAANLGLCEVCREALARLEQAEPASSPTTPSVAQDYLQRHMELLDARRQLGLVPAGDYRQQKRELALAVLESRFAGMPIVRRVVRAGSALVDGIEEGLESLGDFAEKVYNQRMSAQLARRQ